MVCPYKKTNCKYESLYGNDDLSRQCWRYYNDECQNADKYDYSNSRRIDEKLSPPITKIDVKEDRECPPKIGFPRPQIVIGSDNNSPNSKVKPNE